eukprot:g73945.t1
MLSVISFGVLDRFVQSDNEMIRRTLRIVRENLQLYLPYFRQGAEEKDLKEAVDEYDGDVWRGDWTGVIQCTDFQRAAIAGSEPQRAIAGSELPSAAAWAVT